MRNFIAADLRRLSRRKPRLIALFITYIAAVITLYFFQDTTAWNSVSFISTASTVFELGGVIIGIIEVLVAYSSDFKAKIMQLAIGTGIARRKLVLAKLIEIAVLEVFSMGFLYIITIVYGLITGVSLSGAQYGELILCLAANIVANLIYTSLSSFFIFLTQNAGLTALFYALCMVDPIKKALMFVGSYQNWLLKLNLTNYCYSTPVTLFKSHLLLGQFNFGALALIIAYLVIFYFATVFVFDKKELEF